MCICVLATSGEQARAQPADLAVRTEDFEILECARDMVSSRVAEASRSVTNFPAHCYVLFGKRGARLDSRGFFQDAGPTQEPEIVPGMCKCSVVKRIPYDQPDLARQEWNKITEVYDKYTAKDYDILKKNCCSVAAEALFALGNTDQNTYTMQANCSLARKC